MSLNPSNYFKNRECGIHHFFLRPDFLVTLFNPKNREVALQVSDAAQTKYMDDGREGKRGKPNGAATIDLIANDLIKEDLATPLSQYLLVGFY